jgi:predicted DNA-binding antitoxin AbrB/MazE fold protein
MIQKLDAVYENGVLWPLEPIDLQEHEHVTLSLEGSAGVQACNLAGSEDDRRNAGSAEAPTPAEPLEPETRPWRGVFQINDPQAPIFSQEMVVRTSELPSWEPQVTVNRRWVRNDE